MKPGDTLPPLTVTVSARMVVQGASSSRDWQPQHHDHHWAQERAGVRDIFLNTPNQAGWIERYITDHTGPTGRLGKVAFRMRRPICTGDELTFTGTVRDVHTDDAGTQWIDLDIELQVDGAPHTLCVARVAVGDNPWATKEWKPDAVPFAGIRKRGE